MACISIGTAALGAGAGIFSSSEGSDAATAAAQAQAQAAELASKNTMAMYQQTRSDLEPYRDAGYAAEPQYLNLLGLGPEGQAGIQSALAATPGYQFALTQGLQATQNGMAAQGLGVSGAAMKGAANYAEGLAGTTYQSVLNNYYSAMGLGENAAAQTGTIGSGLNAQNSAAITGAGAATASGIVGSANATIGGVNTAMSGINNALMLSAMQSGGLYGGNGNTGTLSSLMSWGGPGS